MSEGPVRTRLCALLADLEPVMLRRVLAARERSPETLPEEILLFESVVVLRRELCAP